MLCVEDGWYSTQYAAEMAVELDLDDKLQGQVNTVDSIQFLSCI